MGKKLRILNAYAGIGGNRKLWGDSHDITAVEFDPAIAEAYKSRFPSDKMVVGDAKQYLLDHYKEFDFIWASPPCQSHSQIRLCGTRRGQNEPIYPDMSLYQVIIFMQTYLPLDTKWVVENVRPFYTPVIKPNTEIDRHLYWNNFPISEIEIVKKISIAHTKISDCEIDLSKYNVGRKDQIIRNQVDYEVGKHILDCALGTVQHKQGGLF